MIDLAPLVNKTVDFKFRGAELKLDLSHALFSSYAIDAGTRLLLKAVGRDEVLLASKKVLDAGCGVGVIGLSVAAAFPDCQVEARDRDLLACAFTERNRRRNKVNNLEVRPGLLALESKEGWASSVYDYILTNIPAKAGAPVIEAFFVRAKGHLSPGGRLAVVIVKPLAEAAKATLLSSGYDLVREERGANHMVYVVALPGAFASAAAPLGPVAAAEPLDFSGLDLRLYERSREGFTLAKAAYNAAGFWGLPEFDTVGYDQAAAADLAERVMAGRLTRSALVLNPGLGHFALWAAQRLSPEAILGASRDYLSLAACGANLALQPRLKAAYRPLSALELDSLEAASLDLLAAFPDLIPEHDWIGPLWDDAGRTLKRGACLIVSTTPTEIQRFGKRKPAGWKLLGEKRKKTFLASAWERA